MSIRKTGHVLVRTSHSRGQDAARGDGKTEFGRVSGPLRIELINALTPQAKGRVERANQTLQDRLVREMRLGGISSIEEAQAFTPAFIAAWNQKFAVPPRDSQDAHRPWTKGADALEEALARREERLLSKALTFSVGGALHCVKTSGPGIAMPTTDGGAHGPVQGSPSAASARIIPSDKIEPPAPDRRLQSSHDDRPARSPAVEPRRCSGFPTEGSESGR